MEHRHENPVTSLDMHVFTSLLYILQCMNEKHPSTCCLAAKRSKKQQIAVKEIREIPVDFLNGSARASTLAFVKFLLTGVPLQKFLFLFNL